MVRYLDAARDENSRRFRTRMATSRHVPNLPTSLSPTEEDDRSRERLVGNERSPALALLALATAPGAEQRSGSLRWRRLRTAPRWRGNMEMGTADLRSAETERSGRVRRRGRRLPRTSWCAPVSMRARRHPGAFYLRTATRTSVSSRAIRPSGSSSGSKIVTCMPTPSPDASTVLRISISSL